MTNFKEILHAWEDNQRAGWALADALKYCREDLTKKGRGEALLCLAEARKLHNQANAKITPIHKALADSLDPTATP